MQLQPHNLGSGWKGPGRIPAGGLVVGLLAWGCASLQGNLPQATTAPTPSGTVAAGIDRARVHVSSLASGGITVQGDPGAVPAGTTWIEAAITPAGAEAWRIVQHQAHRRAEASGSVEPDRSFKALSLRGVEAIDPIQVGDLLELKPYAGDTPGFEEQFTIR
jgi:hypothetical protein